MDYNLTIFLIDHIELSLGATLRFYQWLVPLMALFYCYRLISQYRTNKRLITSTLIWIGFWVAVSALAIIPDVISFNIATLFGFASNITAVIFVAIACIFLFIFYLSAVVEKVEKQMTELVRKLAIENQKLKDELAEAKKKDNADSIHS